MMGWASKINQIRTGCLVFSVVLTGCAGMPSFNPSANTEPKTDASSASAQDSSEAKKASEYTNLPKEPLTAPMLFNILLGEIAGQRGRMDVSGPSYLQAAQKSSDPRVAERAFKIALYGKDKQQALEAGKRWIELVPENKKARQSVIALALRSGEMGYAREQLDYLITHSNSSDEETYKAVTAILLQEPDKKGTLDLAKKLLAEKPDDLHTRLMVAHLSINAGEWRLAETEINNILKQRPNWTQPLIMQAQIQVKNKQPDIAVAQLKAALQRNSRDFDLRMAYARLLVDVRKLEQAKTQFKKLHRMEPENGQVIYSLALLTMGDQQLTEAEGYFKKLLDVGYQKQQAWYYLGAIAEERKNLTQASEWYSKIEAGDHLLEAQIRLAKIDADTGKMNEARGRLKNLRLIQPAHTQRLLLVEGEILNDADLPEQAFDLYSDYLAVLPTDIDVLYARSLLAEKMDRLDVAENDFKAILAKDPDDVRALNAYGYTLADRTTRYQEAYVLVKKALDKTPNDPAILDSMGWVEFKRGNLEAARTHLTKAYEQTQDAEIAAHLGEVLWHLGEKEAALKIWAEGQKTDSKDAVLIDTIRRLKP